MAGEFKVTPQELETGAGNLDKFAMSIDDQLSATRNEVTRLGGGWTGAAQQKFEGLMAEWDKLARAQHDNLTAISKTLRDAGKAYGETEDSVARAFNG